VVAIEWCFAGEAAFEAGIEFGQARGGVAGTEDGMAGDDDEIHVES